MMKPVGSRNTYKFVNVCMEDTTVKISQFLWNRLNGHAEAEITFSEKTI